MNFKCPVPTEWNSGASTLVVNVGSSIFAFNAIALSASDSFWLTSACIASNCVWILEVTPSVWFNSAVVAVIPSKVFNSDAVAVTPSSMFNSSAVELTAVPPIFTPPAKSVSWLNLNVPLPPFAVKWGFPVALSLVICKVSSSFKYKLKSLPVSALSFKCPVPTALNSGAEACPVKLGDAIVALNSIADSITCTNALSVKLSPIVEPLKAPKWELSFAIPRAVWALSIWVSLAPIKLTIVVLKSASSPRASASSLSVFKASGELSINEPITDWTNAVVAICVVLVDSDAVGADGVPVKVGDAISDFNAIALSASDSFWSTSACIASNCVWILEVAPLTLLFISSKSIEDVTVRKSVITFEAFEFTSIASKSTACVSEMKSVITLLALELTSTWSKSTACETDMWSTLAILVCKAESNFTWEIAPSPIAVTVLTATKLISSVPIVGISSLSKTNVFPICAEPLDTKTLLFAFNSPLGAELSASVALVHAPAWTTLYIPFNLASDCWWTRTLSPADKEMVSTVFKFERVKDEVVATFTMSKSSSTAIFLNCSLRALAPSNKSFSGISTTISAFLNKILTVVLVILSIQCISSTDIFLTESNTTLLILFTDKPVSLTLLM